LQRLWLPASLLPQEQMAEHFDLGNFVDWNVSALYEIQIDSWAGLRGFKFFEYIPHGQCITGCIGKTKGSIA
jgi:hypothetical protein